MPPDAQSLLQLLAPLLFVIAVFYVLGPLLPMTRTWARFAIFVMVWLIVLRYLEWRIFTLMLPVDESWFQSFWSWFVFTVELLTYADALILYLVFLRCSDHRAAADAQEARLRALPPDALPTVDIYIPSYDEPIEVLEKTIVGALCLDYPKAGVWVLDDGRRPWLKAYCQARGVGYITPPDSANAKAGNLHHTLTHTDGAFFAIFDADFIPQRNFLMRLLGFFDDPKIGIMQVPHAFYNYDPMQTNLGLRRSMPDDQRFFFEAIMPSRDGWDAAFCCGSNSVTRREALRSIGDALPTGSLTEDMLLTLALLRRGYVTRYLCQRLAFGLAPESLKAFFVQRRRWAQGGIQILYLKEGPLGPGLDLMRRLMFLPTHWITQSFRMLLIIVAPLLFLWTGLKPMPFVTTDALLSLLMPMVLALFGGLCVYAPNSYFPLAIQVHGTFQSFKILSTALATLVKPFGHAFKVTPKGGQAGAPQYEIWIFWLSASLMILTVLGVIVNVMPDWRIVDPETSIPVLLFWAGINIIVFNGVCMIALPMPARDSSFTLDEAVVLAARGGPRTAGRLVSLSLSRADVAMDGSSAPLPAAGEPVRIAISEVGAVAGTVLGSQGQVLRVQLVLPPSVERDLLIRKLYTGGHDPTTVAASAWSVTWAMIASLWVLRTPAREPAVAAVAPPAPEEKLPAISLAIPPRPAATRLADLAAQRQSLGLTRYSGREVGRNSNKD